MFQGAAALSLDAKGRLAIPARHRDALAVENGQVVLTAHPHGCLLVYPVPAWTPIRDKVLAAPSLDPLSAQLKRLLVGFAQEEALDAAGRVLVAPSLRQFARLEKQVWLVGQGSQGATDTTTGAAPFVSAGLTFAVSKALRVGADVLVGLLVPETRIDFIHTTVARWGRPLAAWSCGIEVAW